MSLWRTARGSQQLEVLLLHFILIRAVSVVLPAIVAGRATTTPRVQVVAYLKKVVVDTCTRGRTTWTVWTVKPGGAAAWAAQLRYSRCLGTIYARAHGCAVISRPALSRVTINNPELLAELVPCCLRCL